MIPASDPFARLIAASNGIMVVVTTALTSDQPGGRTVERAGCLVGFHAQGSIDPAHYCVWLSKSNHTYRVAVLGDHLAVHFLTSEDFDVAEHFGTTSGDDCDKFAAWSFDRGPGEVPLLERCPNRLVIRRDTLIDVGGDHVMMMGEVIDAQIDSDGFEPLRFGAVTDLDPGHAAEERPRPPTERAR